MKVAVLADNFFFTSKIAATAASTGCEVVFGRSAEDVPDDVARIIVDLDAESFDAVGEVSELGRMHAAPVFAFARHTHTDRIRSAEEAGAREVMARSAFVDRLAELLRP